jgi:hypothetical protein
VAVPVQPGTEPVGLEVAGRRPPGASEGFLQGVLGQARIAEQPRQACEHGRCLLVRLRSKEALTPV